MSRSQARWACVPLSLALALACTGTVDDAPPMMRPTDPLGPIERPVVASTNIRRLSNVELANTYQAVVGFQPAALSSLPPESIGHLFDRVVNDQTVSHAHLEAFASAAVEAADRLYGEQLLDDIAPSCTDDILPPALASRLEEVPGSSLAVEPNWAVMSDPADPTLIYTLYAPLVQAGYTHTFTAPGRYTIELDIQSSSVGQFSAVEISFDGTLVRSDTNVREGAATIAITVDVTEARPHLVYYDFITQPHANNLRLLFRGLRVGGPEDLSGTGHEAARTACAHELAGALAERAYRRPLSDAERAALIALYDTTAAEDGFASGVRLLIEAILSSPNFLYLVEWGDPVDDGQFRLSPWEVAARLSYGICEEPPDDALRAAARAGELGTVEALEAHARRLVDSPCGRRSVVRFFDQWLWLDRLETLNKDPMLYPEFTAELRAAMLDESNTFIAQMVFDEEAALPSLFDASFSWVTPEVAPIYGLSGVSALERRNLPEDRAGLLTQPGALSVTAGFTDTTPVYRGVYVLENILCQEMEPPPAELMVAAPFPDPNLSTRERWAMHSSEPACAQCHRNLDPVGFAFENFDAIGRVRTVENGRPVDASGGAPSLDIANGSIEGGAALARLVARRPELLTCFARQWLRFTQGRLEVELDRDAVTAMVSQLEESSVREALVRFMASDRLFYRTEMR